MAKLSIMPNRFGEFGGCVVNINWGYLVRPTIRHNARWGIEKTEWNRKIVGVSRYTCARFSPSREKDVLKSKCDL